MKFLFKKEADTTAAESALQAAKSQGWATLPNTYTKICVYDYPSFYSTNTN